MKKNMKLAALMAALAIFASAALAGCSADVYEEEPAYSRNHHGYIDQFSATETPSAEPADADPEESVSLDDPVGITTPETEAPATQPPATQPPATQPPATRPPATQPPATQPPATQAPPTQTPSTPAPAAVDFNSIEGISRIYGLTADVQDSIYKCYIRVDRDSNPYDVEWNYGSLYETYVAACDWSLVFDADYYMEQFPMLAKLYHYDEALLLRHFQTVGIHEGRQGSAKFNVMAYAQVCSDEVWYTFEGDCAPFYIYYMLNYKTEKKLDTVSGDFPKQLCAQLTALQARELKQVNRHRAFDGVDAVVFDSELAALANYRGWMDAEYHYRAHDGLYGNLDDIYECLRFMNARSLDENTVKDCETNDKLWLEADTDWSALYRKSHDHNEAMVNPNQGYFACSNMYVSDTDYRCDASHGSGYLSCVEFDLFVPSLSTALNP